MEPMATECNETKKDENAPEYRDRLRTWLVKMINSGTIPGLMWENADNTIFRMPWKHAGRQDYNLEEDSKIFMAWAKHSGRYREGIDKPEPIVWKTRLRCALNKMPDIRELPERSRLDVSEPYRVYQLLPPVHKASQIRRRLHVRSISQDVNSFRVEPNIPTVASTQNISSNIARPPPFRSNPSQRELLEPIRASFPVRSNHAVNLNHRYGAGAQTSYAGTSGLSNTTSWFSPPVTGPSLHPAYMPVDFGASGRDAPFLSNPLHPTLTHYPIVPPLGHHIGSMINSSRLSFGQNINYQLPPCRPAARSSQPFGVRSLLGDKEFELERNADKKEDLCLKLKESQERIETLQQDLTRYRDAHAREREAREMLEIERENMRTVLERMGDGLRLLAVQWQPNDAGFLEQISPTDKRIEEVTDGAETRRVKYSRQQSSLDDNPANSRKANAAEVDEIENKYLKRSSSNAYFNIDGRGSSNSQSSREEQPNTTRKRGPIDLSDESSGYQTQQHSTGLTRRCTRPHSSPETPDYSFHRRELFRIVSSAGTVNETGLKTDLERDRSRSLSPSRKQEAAGMLNVFLTTQQPSIQVT